MFNFILSKRKKDPASRRNWSSLYVTGVAGGKVHKSHSTEELSRVIGAITAKYSRASINDHKIFCN